MGIIIIIIIILLDLLARFRPRTINKLSEGDSDANYGFNCEISLWFVIILDQNIFYICNLWFHEISTDFQRYENLYTIFNLSFVRVL